MLRRFLTVPAPLLLAASLSACAAAMPGYVPPPSDGAKKSPIASALLKPAVTGDVGGDGRYVPSDDERKLDCRKLTGSMQVMMDRLRRSGDRREPSVIAKTLQTAGATTFKRSTAGSDISSEVTRERSRLVAYNELLAEKKCKTVDIDAELAKPRG
jgi:hypothetical protein